MCNDHHLQLFRMMFQLPMETNTTWRIGTTVIPEGTYCKQILSHFRGWLGPRERNCKKAGFRAWVLWNIATHSFSPLFLLHHKLSSHQIRFLIIFHIHLFHFTFYTSRTFCLTLFIYPFTSSFVLSRTFHLALFIILCHRL